MLRVNVPGGANSGIKRPKSEPRKDWSCSNGHANRGYVVRCLVTGCNEKRA